MTNCGSQSAYIRWCAGRDIDAVSYITLKDVAAGIHLTVSDNGRGIESLSRRRLSPLEPGSGSPPDTGLRPVAGRPLYRRSTGRDATRRTRALGVDQSPIERVCRIRGS
jgi:hypothetical protein